MSRDGWFRREDTVKYSYQLDKAEFNRIFTTIDNFVAKLAEVGQKLMDMETKKDEKRLEDTKLEVQKAKTESLDAEGRRFRAKYDMASKRFDVEAAKARKLAACRTEAQLAEAKAAIDAEGPNPFDDPDIES